VEPVPLLEFRRVRRIGHKGADALAPGNTLASYRVAVELGVDMIELDVVRPESDFADGSDWRRAAAGPAAGEPLLNAHDWGDARRRDPLTLAEALDAFTRAPLDGVEIDLDLKLAGREDELLTMLRERDLTGRAMVSTMYLDSLAALRDLDGGLPLGWTYPKVSRDWMRTWWARIVSAGALPFMRARLPRIAAQTLPRLGVQAMWVFHPLVSRRLVSATDDAGIELIAWTVDDLPEMQRLRDIGVDGICTNDPRLFARI
jgi:glycerophosphoryl diester phosphodiesterase